MSTHTSDRTEVIKQNRLSEFQLRGATNLAHVKTKAFYDVNDDIKEIPKYRACFSKSLKHDAQGTVDKDEFMKLYEGSTQCKCLFEKIEYPGKLRLVNPSSIYSLDLIGPYKSSVPIAPCPSFCSEQIAAEMIELYNMALCRDVPFDQYNNDPSVLNAINDLNPVSNLQGTTQTIFRGSNPGATKGPFVSQFFYSPYSHGVTDIEQIYRFDKPGVDYMTEWDKALSVQNGTVLESAPPRNLKRYISTLRDGATFVHLDDPSQIITMIAGVLKKIGCPSAKGIPYGKSIKELAFIDLGGLDYVDLCMRAVRSAMLCAWYHKYGILRLRPEEYGMQVHQVKTGNLSSKHFSSDLLESDVLNRIHAKYGSYLLPQAYPEGSPVHPAYPAGHAAFAGAITTITKAFFDEDFQIDAFQPSPDGQTLVPLGYKLRVGYELDKMASNIDTFRDAAGVHWRSDGAGLELGEEIAIIILKDHIMRYPHKVKFSFHKRNGERVKITNETDD